MHKRVAERWWRLGVFAFLLAAVVSTGCDFPRDPKGTLDQVQNGTMRVGVAANDPWTRMEDGEASGVAVELLRDFAGGWGQRLSSCKGRRPSCWRRPTKAR